MAAWGLWAATLTVAGIGVALIMSGTAVDPVADAPLLLVCLAFATVGAVVASRVPRNPIGWVFLTAGLFGSYGVVADLIFVRVQVPGRVVVWMAWLQQSTWSMLFLGIGAVPVLLFPDGRPPSRRWRWVVWVMVVAIALLTVVGAVAPGPMVALPAMSNPLGIDALDPERTLLGGALRLVGVGAFLVSFPAAAASMVARFRRARGEERQQLKWFVYAAAWATVGILVVFLTGLNTGRDAGWAGVAVLAVALLGLLALPASAGVAILRYRLYDIDRVINRTLVYGLLTVLLGSVYAAGAVLAPAALGVGEGNDLAVAASTLLVAALFLPLRRRVQGFVDRRFDRSRYDTRRTVEAFSARLRDEVDLDEVEQDLVTVAAGTLRPAAVGLWLKAPGPIDDQAGRSRRA